MRWWNHSYPFRKQIKFTNTNQSLDSTKTLTFAIPDTIIEQGKLDPLTLNFAVVYSYREITKSVPAYMDYEDGMYYVTFQIFKTINPSQTVEDYFFYYGADEENIIVDNTTPVPMGTIELVELNDGPLSHNGIGKWTFVDHDNGAMAVSNEDDAKFSMVGDFIGAKIVFLSSSQTGWVRVQLGDSDWMGVNTSNDDLSTEWAMKEFSIMGSVSDHLAEFLIDPSQAGETKHLRIQVTGEFGGFRPNEENITDYPLGEDFSSLIENSQSSAPVIVTSISLYPFSFAHLNAEEVDNELPWSSKLGGTVNVG